MRVLETCLYAADLTAARTFYAEILGLPVIAAVPERHVFFRAAAAVLLIFNPTATLQETVLPPHGAVGPGHVAFAASAAEIATWRTRLMEAGVPVALEHRWPQGGLSLYCHDPAGNVVEFVEPTIWGLADEEHA